MKRSTRRQATRPARRAIARVIWDLDPKRLALLLECARDLAEQQRAADGPVRVLSPREVLDEVTGGRAA